MRVEAAGMQAEAVDAAGRLNPSYSRQLQLAATKSRFMRAMTSSLISLGRTASHFPMLAQLPNNLRLAAHNHPPGIPRRDVAEIRVVAQLEVWRQYHSAA